MTSLLNCIQAAKRAVKRKAAAQALPAAAPSLSNALLPASSRPKPQGSPTAAVHLANTTLAVPALACSAPCERLEAIELHQSEVDVQTPQEGSSPNTIARQVLLATEQVLLPALLPAPPVADLAAFAAKNFYGAPRLTAVELRVQRFLSHVRQRLRTVGHPFDVFPLQAQAFEFADAHELGDLLRC